MNFKSWETFEFWERAAVPPVMSIQVTAAPEERVGRERPDATTMTRRERTAMGPWRNAVEILLLIPVQGSYFQQNKVPGFHGALNVTVI